METSQKCPSWNISFLFLLSPNNLNTCIEKINSSYLILHHLSINKTNPIQSYLLLLLKEDIASHLGTRISSSSNHSSEGSSPIKMNKQIDPSASELLNNLKREAHENVKKIQKLHQKQ